MTDIETLPADTFMGPKRYRITVRCLRCGKPFNYTTSRIMEDDRPCPRKACKSAALNEEIERRARNMAAIIESQRPPGHIGDSITVKAIDATAEVVMQDYALTDLKDNIRHGEAMAPKLPPDKQKLADGFFGGAFAGMSISPATAMPGRRGESPLTLVRTEKLK